MKAHELMVGKIKFTNYRQAGEWYKMTTCLVLAHGRLIGEYVNFGDGEPGLFHVLNRSAWRTFSATMPVSTLEAVIVAAIQLAETERKLRERVRRDGKLVWRNLIAGQYRYHVVSMNPYTEYLPNWIRARQPMAEFYQYQGTNWEWVR